MTRLLPLILVALLAGGCGGSDEPSVTTDGEQPTDTTTQPASGEDGAQLFSSTCGGCHTLAAAETSGAVGPNLDDLAPDRERVLSAIAEGPGSMPSNLLEGPDAETVADFVAENAGGG